MFKELFNESAVGKPGRTGVKDAEAYEASPELRAEFKKIVQKLGGKALALKLLREMNFGKKILEGKPSSSETYKKIKDWNLKALMGFAKKSGVPKDAYYNRNNEELLIDEIMDYLYGEDWYEDITEFAGKIGNEYFGFSVGDQVKFLYKGDVITATITEIEEGKSGKAILITDGENGINRSIMVHASKLRAAEKSGKLKEVKDLKYV